MTRHSIRFFSCLLLFCAFAVPVARAQDAPTDNSMLQSTQVGPSQEDIQKAIANYYQNFGPTAGGADPRFFPNNMTMGLPFTESDKEEEQKKTYRYNLKDEYLNGVAMPQRTFNNISYPY